MVENGEGLTVSHYLKKKLELKQQLEFIHTVYTDELLLHVLCALEISFRARFR